MKVIGLCGGSGSGKGEVCAVFRENGILAIDTDAVYRNLTSRPGPLLTELKAEFGKEIISDSGSLNRRVLATIVFCSEGSENKLKRLNEIAHKHILDETRAMLSQHSADGARLGVVDAPVLFESGFDSECDYIVSVVADRCIRIKRIMARDSITEIEAEQRIDTQISDDELISRSDYVIYNNGDIHSLRQQVIKLIEELNK